MLQKNREKEKKADAESKGGGMNSSLLRVNRGSCIHLPRDSLVYFTLCCHFESTHSDIEPRWGTAFTGKIKKALSTSQISKWRRSKTTFHRSGGGRKNRTKDTVLCIYIRIHFINAHTAVFVSLRYALGFSKASWALTWPTCFFLILN